MRHSNPIVKTLGLTVFFIVIGSTAFFYLMRKNIDPSFYQFLESKPGRTVAKIMGWSVDFELPPTDIPESEMSDEEIHIKRELEKQMQSDHPKHHLIMKNGEVLTGRIASYNNEKITFKERYGKSGQLAIQISRSRVADVREVNELVPLITSRDVLLKMEFPEFEFHRIPPYTTITDDNFFRARKSVKLLQRLHSEFTSTFEELITRPERGDGIQLLFFIEEKRYREYAEKYAPRLENSSGFYSPKLDRLIVFNQLTSKQLRETKRELKRREKLYRRNAATPEERERVKLWRSDAARTIVRHAEEQTEFTIRHEGGHQLLFTYGIHSNHHSENTWLIEGLAVYCEGVRLGDRLRERLAIIKTHLRKNKTIPMDELVNSRSAMGLFVFGSERRVHLAYAESWALVQFFMQPKYRAKFFAYIRYIRDPKNIDHLSSPTRFHTLANAMGMDPAQLEQKWILYLQRL